MSTRWGRVGECRARGNDERGGNVALEVDWEVVSCRSMLCEVGD